MIRFGLCLPGNFTLPGSSAENESEQLRALLDGYRFVKETGYDYMEFSVGNLMLLSDADMEKAASLYRQGLLKVEACNGFIPGSLPLTGPKVNTEKIRTYLEQSLHRMASIGVKTVVFGSGQARRIPDGFSEEQASRQLEDFLITAEAIARPLGITIVIEPLNHRETNTLLTVTESGRVVRRLNLPNLKLLADLYHTYTEQEPAQVLTDHRDILSHIHVAEPVNRTAPVDCPYLRQCSDALCEAGYDNRISIECNFTDLPAEAAKALPVMKDLFRAG